MGNAADVWRPLFEGAALTTTYTTVKGVDTNVQDHLDSIDHPVRPVMSKSNITIQVDAGGGGDYLTVQEAINQIPLHMAHTFRINIADGIYDEDIIVPEFIFERFISQPYDSNVKGSLDGLEIVGNTTTPSNVTIKSILFCGGQTYRCKLEGLKIINGSPYADANASLESRRGCEVVLKDIIFATVVTGIRCCSAYGGIITIKEGVHIGTDIYTGAFVAKVGGHIQIASNDPAGNPNSGSSLGNLFNAQDGSMISVESDLAGGTPFRYAQFVPSATLAASVGGTINEWDAGEKGILHDVKIANESHVTHTGTTDASGNLDVPHTLVDAAGAGVAPTFTIANIIKDSQSAWTHVVRSKGTTNVRLFIGDGSGGNVATTSVTVDLYSKIT